MEQPKGGSGMKKFLIGCGILTLLVILVVCSVGGYFTFKTVKWGQEIAENIEAAQEGYDQLEEAHPFVKPEGEITMEADRLAAYFEVREALSTKLEEQSFVAKINNAESGTKPDMGVMDWINFGTYIAGGVHKDAVSVLEANDMPRSEYIYYTRGVLMTLAEGARTNEEFEAALLDLDNALNKFSEFSQGMQGGSGGQMGTADDMRGFIGQISGRDTISEENIEMLQPYIAELKESNPTTVFFDIIIYSFAQQTANAKRQKAEANAGDEVSLDELPAETE